jgi:hypothetical protein
MALISSLSFATWHAHYASPYPSGVPELDLTIARTIPLLEEVEGDDTTSAVDRLFDFPMCAIGAAMRNENNGDIVIKVAHHLFKLSPMGMAFSEDVNETIFGIEGTGNHSSVVVIPHKIFLTDASVAKILTPSLSDFQGVTGNLQALQVLTTTAISAKEMEDKIDSHGNPLPLVQPRGAISIPAFLVNAFETKLPLPVLMQCIDKINTFATEELDANTVKKLWKSLFPTLQHLWCLYKLDENKEDLKDFLVNTGEHWAITTDHDAVKRVKACEATFLTMANQVRVPPPPPGGMQGGVQSGGPLELLITTLTTQHSDTMAAVREVLHGSIEKSGAAEKWTKRLFPQQQQFMLNVAVTTAKTTSIKPNAECKQLLEAPKTNVIMMAQSCLNQTRSSTQVIDNYIATMLLNATFVNFDSGEHPKNLSIFYSVPPLPQEKSTDNMSPETLELLVRMNNITPAQIQKVTTSKIRVPMHAHKFFETLKNFIAIIDLVCYGPTSFLYKKLTDLKSELEAISQNFELASVASATFLTEVMVVIDARVQGFTKSCAKATSPDEIMTSVTDRSREEKIVSRT